MGTVDLLFMLRKVTRPLSKVRGLRRIPETIRSSFGARGGVRTISDFDGDMIFRCYLDSHVSSHIFWAGSYSGDQLRLLDRLLRPEMIFFDIGANEGEHSVFVAKRVPRGKVYSFEPSTKIFQRLVHNVTMNALSNVVTVPKGLGHERGELPLYGRAEAADDGTWNEGLSTLFPRTSVDIKLETIQIVRLDDYVAENGIQRVDLMKIDVEGGELSVLRGAEETIKRFRPLIILEVADTTSLAAGYPAQKLLDYLGERGYRFESILESSATTPIRTVSDHATRDVLCIPI